ncbi:2-oxo acid dehydrogenase subunit E2 [Buchnera aphidicola]|uniref:2-oxo acid dehydrogenase subunit E2 n=1 Tax=Buchnera aphidicola TaxID=9 RepID=UPI002237EBC7|nr:2-oxo acid dehydrogenase subunit E2 [Buchnera aphidicola]MCW5197705.1 2-oxo acid dehydrogenase subunit E2 [Buchnera aphidicola (Chaitophorus viminalis)]
MKEKIKILVPELPESVHTATIIKWHKNIGDKIYRDDILVDLETDKIMIEVPSPETGILTSIVKNSGNLVSSHEILCYINKKNNINMQSNFKNIQENLSPSLRRKNKLLNQKKLLDIKETKIFPKKETLKNNNCVSKNFNDMLNNNVKIKKIISMSSLRKKISEKLIETQNNTAMLTTFNEVNMSSIIKIRKKFGEIFKKKNRTKLGFMSFFIKSVVSALKKYPIINAIINKDKIIFYDEYNINIAVSTDRGLIAPVIFQADQMSIADIEKKIKYYSNQGKHNRITIQELNGGTFTITNGGVFGSLFSTPIINSPQSAILGMHNIQDRVIVTKQQKIKIAPMMYISLSYDHRLIDGKDAIGFLNQIKNILENFIQVILDI